MASRGIRHGRPQQTNEARDERSRKQSKGRVSYVIKSPEFTKKTCIAGNKSAVNDHEFKIGRRRHVVS
jgi:hypothetical protein